MIEHDKLKMFELLLTISKFILDVKFENSFGVIPDSPHVRVFQISMNSDRKEPV